MQKVIYEMVWASSSSADITVGRGIVASIENAMEALDGWPPLIRIQRRTVPLMVNGKAVPHAHVQVVVDDATEAPTPELMSMLQNGAIRLARHGDEVDPLQSEVNQYVSAYQSETGKPPTRDLVRERFRTSARRAGDLLRGAIEANRDA